MVGDRNDIPILAIAGHRDFGALVYDPVAAMLLAKLPKFDVLVVVLRVYAYGLVLWLLGVHLALRVHRSTLFSQVQGHEGLCVPVWEVSKQDSRYTLCAYTEFFCKAWRIPGWGRYLAVGPVFHGYLARDGAVTSLRAEGG